MPIVYNYRYIFMTPSAINLWVSRKKRVWNWGDLDADSKPYIGWVEIGVGKIVGRQSADGKVRWRLDFSHEEGPNATKFAIPFEGDISSVELIFKYLNS